jgi:hypothetical protein
MILNTGRGFSSLSRQLHSVLELVQEALCPMIKRTAAGLTLRDVLQNMSLTSEWFHL